MEIDKNNLYKILNTIADDTGNSDLKVIARFYKIQRIGVAEADGEFHLTQEVKE